MFETDDVSKSQYVIKDWCSLKAIKVRIIGKNTLNPCIVKWIKIDPC